MRKLTPWILVLLAAFSLAFLWLKRGPAPPRKLIHETNLTSWQGETNSSRANATKVGASPVKRERMNIPKMLEIEREREVERGLDQWRTPISFYGKVVDEKGDPVPGAEIDFGWNNLNGSPSKKSKSDAAGLFSLEGEQGKILEVKVSKPGYYRSRKDRDYFFYAGENENFLPDPNNPIIYHLRKRGEAEPLVPLKQNYRVARDGTPLEIDLLHGKPVPQGDLKIQCWTSDQGKKSGEKYDWTCVISFPGGGLLESTNEFDLTAPEAGYQPSYQIQMLEAEPETWKNDVEKKFFFKTGSGLYGRMTFAMIAGGDHFCMIQSYVNPSGSRNLEYDPNKSTPAQ